MGIFDRRKKKGGDGGQVVSQSVTFTVGADVRQVDEAGVAALDSALGSVGHGELLHVLDPRRISAFSSGGPSTWSVAFVEVGNDRFFVTYGNSDRIDPARAGVSFELSIRIPAGSFGLWAAMLLRQLVRYMLVSGRELRVSDFMPFPTSITRVVEGATDPQQFPPSTMDAVFLVADPLLPRVASPRGPIEIRRVVGIYPDERSLMEPWSVSGLAELIRRWSPDLTTDIGRPSLAADRSFAEAMAAGSRREGSQFGFVAVPGVSWEAAGSGYRIQLPGGAEALRIHRMVEARLGHGRNLLVHDVDPKKTLAVALEPSADWSVALHGDVLVLHVPLDSPYLRGLASPPAGPIVWMVS